MKKHNSKPHNPNIAHGFYLAGQIESWGRGIEKIYSSCKENNLPLPIYHVKPTDIMIQFNAPESLVIDNFIDMDVKLNDRLNDTMKSILKQVSIDPAYTTTEWSELIGVSRTSIANSIKKLKDLEYIERIGNSKNGYWKIKKKII